MRRGPSDSVVLILRAPQPFKLPGGHRPGEIVALHHVAPDRGEKVHLPGGTHYT